VPGAMLLAGEASLRAGGGKLQVATTDSVAAQMAVTIPEALVSRTPELQSGDISPEAAEQVLALAEGASAILLGPGITSPESATRLLREIVPHLRDQHVVIDALGSAYVTEDVECLHHLGTTPVLTVNPTELAFTLGVEEDEVEDDLLGATVDLAAKARAVVLCGSSDKYVANPGGETWVVSAGCPGLGISGSGDVQAGIVTGLLARGAEAEQAAVWGAWLHGTSGEVLAERIGPLGFLARELPGVVPGLLRDLAG
jgi:ADP-dependent NAD(P)H-hydrate dehydratase